VAGRLDTAFANLFGAHFREDYPEEKQRAARPRSESFLSFPYERTRANLDGCRGAGDPHPSHGWKLRYTNRDTGKDPFSTLAVSCSGCPRIHRQQASQHRRRGVLRGRRKGGVHVGAAHLEFAAHDVFVVPSWRLTASRLPPTA